VKGKSGDRMKNKAENEFMEVKLLTGETWIVSMSFTP